MAEKNLIPITSCEQIPNKVYEELLELAKRSVKIRTGTYPVDAAQDAVLKFIKYIKSGRIIFDGAKGEYLVRSTNAPVKHWIRTVANSRAIEYIRKKIDEPGRQISIEDKNDSGSSGQYLMDDAVNDEAPNTLYVVDGEASKINDMVSDLDDLIANLDYDPKLYEIITTGFHDCLDCACEAYKQRKPSKSVHVVNTEDEPRKQLLVAEYLYIFTKRKFSDEETLSHVVLCQELGLIMEDGVAGNFKTQFMVSVSDCLKSKLAIYTTEAESLA